MADIFKEQIVKKVPNMIDRLKKFGLIFVALLLTVFLMAMPFIQMLGTFGLLIVAALWFGVYYLLSFFKIEYEYAFTNGSLDIDIIYAKSRRKRVFTGDVKDFEIMARTDNQDKAAEFSSAQATFDYSSGVESANIYAFLARYKERKVKIIIEPNDMMRQAFATVLSPRKFIR